MSALLYARSGYLPFFRSPCIFLKYTYIYNGIKCKNLLVSCYNGIKCKITLQALFQVVHIEYFLLKRPC